MAFITLEELNSNPIYQPPKWWLDTIITDDELMERWFNHEKNLNNSVNDYMRKNGQELIKRENQKFKVGNFMYNRNSSWDGRTTRRNVMVKIIKRTKCFLTYQIHEYHAGIVDGEVDFAKKQVNEFRKKIYTDNKGNERIMWSDVERAEVHDMVDYVKLNLQSKKTAATTLQRAWRKCRYNPEYKMCETVLLNNLRADGVQV